MTDLDPEDLIDRKAEQELFTSLVAKDSPARILTIVDGGGRGKSSLLGRLAYNCQHEIKPAVPACLLELDKLEEPSPFALLSEVIKRLTGGKEIRDYFAKFNSLNHARTSKDFTPFAYAGGAGWYGQAMGRARAGRMESGSGNNIGVMQEIKEIRADSITLPTVPFFTDEQEQRARERCVEAFFDDLRAICATLPMVLLLDAWERCNLSLRDWIVDEVIGHHVLHEDVSLRPARLALVIAGRPRDPIKTPHGLRPDPFKRFFSSDDLMAATVKSFASLSEWDNDHVRDFVKLGGFSEPDDDEVNFIRTRLKQGLSLEKIVSILKLYRAELDAG
jgi:hypothetical protein